MRARSLGVVAVLSFFAFIFASLGGIGLIWLIGIAAAGSGSDAEPIGAAAVLLLGGGASLFAARLGAPLFWPLLGVFSGIAASILAVLWAFRDFGE